MVSQLALAGFFRRLATMLHAGIPIHEAVDFNSTDGEDPKLDETVEAIVNRLETGWRLSQAMAEHQDTFPSHRRAPGAGRGRIRHVESGGRPAGRSPGTGGATATQDEGRLHLSRHAAGPDLYHRGRAGRLCFSERTRNAGVPGGRASRHHQADAVYHGDLLRALRRWAWWS